jgi:hypothetical protein
VYTYVPLNPNQELSEVARYLREAEGGRAPREDAAREQG